MSWLTVALSHRLLLSTHSFCSFPLGCFLNMPGSLPTPAPTSFAFPTAWCIFSPRYRHRAFISFRHFIGNHLRMRPSLYALFLKCRYPPVSSHTCIVLYAPSLHFLPWSVLLYSICTFYLITSSVVSLPTIEWKLTRSGMFVCLTDYCIPSVYNR